MPRTFNVRENLKTVTEETVQKLEKSIGKEIATGKYGNAIVRDAATGTPRCIIIDDDLVNTITSKARKGGRADKRFDLNIIEGEIAEGTLAEIMQDASGATVEVKRDFMVSKTGNLAVEFMCSNKPSGISTSQATWWAHVLDGPMYNGEVIVLIKRKRLERLLVPARIKKGGDRNRADMYLIRAEELLKAMEGIS